MIGVGAGPSPATRTRFARASASAGSRCRWCPGSVRPDSRSWFGATGRRPRPGPLARMASRASAASGPGAREGSQACAAKEPRSRRARPDRAYRGGRRADRDRAGRRLSRRAADARSAAADAVRGRGWNRARRARRRDRRDPARVGLRPFDRDRPRQRAGAGRHRRGLGPRARDRRGGAPRRR